MKTVVALNCLDVSEALLWAQQMHVGQTYDGEPYTVHLQAADMVLHAAGVPAEGYGRVLHVATLLHDIVEDTDATAAQVESRFGYDVGRLVHAVTNEPGKNRAERNLKTYPKILGTPNAIVVKLADRIANVASAKGRASDGLYQMYRKEWPGFSEALRAAPAPEVSSIVIGVLWERLEGLFA